MDKARRKDEPTGKPPESHDPDATDSFESDEAGLSYGQPRALPSVPRHIVSEPLYRHSLHVYSRAFGYQHPLVAVTIQNYASYMRRQGYCSHANDLEEWGRSVNPWLRDWSQL